MCVWAIFFPSPSKLTTPRLNPGSANLPSSRTWIPPAGSQTRKIPQLASVRRFASRLTRSADGSVPSDMTRRDVSLTYVDGERGLVMYTSHVKTLYLFFFFYLLSPPLSPLLPSFSSLPLFTVACAGIISCYTAIKRDAEQDVLVVCVRVLGDRFQLSFIYSFNSFTYLLLFL